MVNRNLIRNLEDDTISQELENLFASDEDLASLYLPDPDVKETKFQVNEIVKGKIVRVDSEAVIVDVGFKSEGTITRAEWSEHDDPPNIGDEIEVLIEDLEDELGQADDPSGLIRLSKVKADHIIHWRDVISKVNEMDHEIKQVEIRKVNLESIFLELTGKELRD